MKSLVHWRAVFQGLLILALTAYAPGARNEEAADVAAPPTSTSGDFEGLRGLLESRGWKVERTSDGSTLLIPVRETAEAQNQMLPVQPDLTTVDGIDRLRNALEARSWRVERGAGGSLLLIPATRPAAQEPEPWRHLHRSYRQQPTAGFLPPQRQLIVLENTRIFQSRQGWNCR